MCTITSNPSTLQHKKYTHVASEGAGDEVVPSTFVMERGKVGKTLNQLVLDLRRVMEPHTASKLKVTPPPTHCMQQRTTHSNCVVFLLLPFYT